MAKAAFNKTRALFTSTLDLELRKKLVKCYVWSIALFIHSFSSLPYDRSKASSKASSPHSAIQSFLLQMRVSSPFLKVIQ